MFIHSISRCYNTLYTYHMTWMWDAVHEGLEPQPWYYNINRSQPYPNFPYIYPDLHRCNHVRMDPYAHSQHIKVLNHIVYIWYECGMQSRRVWSLSHDITTSLGLSLGWQCWDLCLLATPPKRQTFLSVADMSTMSAQHVSHILLSWPFFWRQSCVGESYPRHTFLCVGRNWYYKFFGMCHVSHECRN